MKRFLLGCGLASALMGCSLIVDADKECSAARDCAAGRQCVQGYCIKASLHDLITERCSRTYAENIGGGAMNSDAPLSEDTILIGSLMPYTGELAAYGPKIDQGVALAVSEIAQANGISSRNLAVISCDTATDPATAVESARYLIDTVGVPAIIGPAGSSEVLSVHKEVAKERGTLLITPSGTAMSISDGEEPGEDLLWRTCPSDQLQGAAIANYLKGSGMSKIAMVFRDDTYGNGLNDVVRTGLCSSFSCDNDQVFENHSYDAAAYGDDQAALMTGLATFNPSATVLIAYNTDGANFLKMAEGKLKKFIVTDGMKADNLASLEGVGNEILCRLLGTQPASPNDPAYQAFKLNYKAKFNEPDGAFSANAYDAAYLIAFALASLNLPNHPERITGKEIAQGLRRLYSGQVFPPGRSTFQKAVNQLISSGEATMDYSGASGPLDFDAFGDPTSSIEAWALNVDTDKTESLGVIQNADGTYVGQTVVPAVPGRGATCATLPAK